MDVDCCNWYEHVLPKPPVPTLEATLKRYLEYASVVAVGQNASLVETHKSAEKFIDEARPLQDQLLEIAESTKNWATKFWLPEMYLRVRLPLPVNSNPGYIFPKMNFSNSKEHIKYTAILTRAILEFKNKIDVKKISKEKIHGADNIPMCMQQYDRILNCYRQPGIDEDIQLVKPKTHESNEHLIVMCRNQTFVMHTRINGQLLSFADIIYQLEKIDEISKVNQNNTINIGACGVGDRNTCAQFWQEMLAVEQNNTSLEWVKSALFVVCLDMDESPRPLNRSAETELIERGKHVLVGNGANRFGLNRWYDATIQLIVSSNGFNGLCIEHSTAEGIVIMNMAENAIRHAQKYFKSNLMMSADESRRVHPKTLSWHLSTNARDLLRKQLDTFREHSNELDLQVLIFDNFGKEAIKSWKISPDGFIQLAMQLAHYRTHGYLVSSYESASIRRFAAGRVDNIRANTHEALEWVTAMNCKSTSRAAKVDLLRKAAKKQAQVTVENVTGYGIDNHLCALYCLAKERKLATGEELPKLFLDELWNDVMRFPLSTSQVTTSTDIRDSYLCYGAVVRDGYGCPYSIQPDRIVFAPTAFKSNARTNLNAFKLNLKASCLEMRDLLS